MSRILIGFFLGALVFNTDATVRLMGAVAETISYMMDVGEQAGREIGDKAVDELRQRELIE